MKAKIKIVERYDIEINGKTYKGMQKTSDRHGMTHYSGNGVEIVTEQRSFIEEAFFNFAPPCQSVFEVGIVSATTGILASND